MFADVICRPSTAARIPLTLTALSPTMPKHYPIQHQLYSADTGLNTTFQRGCELAGREQFTRCSLISNMRFSTRQIEKQGNLLSIGDYMLTK